MVPEFDVKKINSKISHDILANIFTVAILVTVGIYFAISHGFHHSDLAKFALIIGMVSLQVISHFLPKLKDWDFINSGGLGALIIYNVAVGLAFFWFLPLYSPFVLILPAVMFITIYYRGLSGFLLSSVLLILVVSAVTLQNGYPAVELGKYFPYLTIILGIIYAGIIQRVSAIDNEVRSEFQRVSNKVELDREQLNSLISNLTEAIVATDREGNVLFHNDAATELLEADKTFTGHHLSKLLTLYNKQNQSVDVLSQARQQTKDIQPEGLHLINAHKETINLYIDVTPISSNYNQQAQKGFIILLRDITKEKTLEQQRDEFIAVAADELRNPIAVAEGNISVVLSTHAAPPLDPNTTTRLRQAHQSIVFLGGLVNQLDLLHRTETKALDIKAETVNPKDLLTKLASSYQPEATKRGLELMVSVEPNLVEVKNSTTYIYEILQKYLTNALKYTPKGQIYLRAANGEPGTIKFSVTDTGIGVGQSDKPKLFHKFYRSEDYHTKQTHGTGLGLYIVLKIASQLQAKVGFSSEINKGSTFYIQVPTLDL